MKVRSLAVISILALATWLPIQAQQPAAPADPAQKSQASAADSADKPSAKHDCCCAAKDAAAQATAAASDQKTKGCCHGKTAGDAKTSCCDGKDAKEHVLLRQERPGQHFRDELLPRHERSAVLGQERANPAAMARAPKAQKRAAREWRITAPPGPAENNNPNKKTAPDFSGAVFPFGRSTIKK